MGHSYFQGIKVAKSAGGVHILPDTDSAARHAAPAIVGPHADAPVALVAQHLEPDGSHARHVVMLGFRDRTSAMDQHRAKFPRARLGSVQAVPVETLRANIAANAPLRIRKGEPLTLLRLEKSDYERVDPRTGKVEHVHDSRVKHVVTEHRDGGSSRFDYGIQREPGGHRIVMRMAAGHGGREHASAWESAMLGGLHGSADEAHKKLGQNLAQAHRTQGSQVEYHDGDAQKHFDNAVTEHGRREKANAKAAGDAEVRHQREAERQAQLDIDFTGARFKKVTFSMNVTDGEPEQAEGWGIAGLVVHRVGEGRYAKYRVSHVGSGRTLGLEYDSTSQAKMAAWRLSKVGDWTRPAKEITGDSKKLAPLIAALRIDPRAEFPEPASAKKSATVFEGIGDFIKSLDLTRRPTRHEPDDVTKSFESEYPLAAQVANGRQVTCSCAPGRGEACACSVSYGGATKPMKGVSKVKKSEIDGVSLRKSEGGEAIMKALRENPALRLVNLVTDGRFGLAPEHEDVQVLIHKRQTAERIEKALREREPGVSPTDLIQLDTGRVRAGLAPYLVRASAPTTTPGVLRKGDDALARAAAWLDAVAATENGATR